jgi:hypothetical protein
LKNKNKYSTPKCKTQKRYYGSHYLGKEEPPMAMGTLLVMKGEQRKLV